MQQVPTTTTRNDDDGFRDSEGHIGQWKDQEDGVLIFQALEYLDVATLIQRKPVCKKWQQHCNKAIEDKCDGKKKSFQSNEELKKVVVRYTSNRYQSDAEEIATTYGYPIDRWDVSIVKDFSNIFSSSHTKYFNEPIGSWDVSNANTMIGMFAHCERFNQDISNWDVSKVTKIHDMFCYASMFNQDISNWDVSNVTNMVYMFCNAEMFDQDISNWDVSSVTHVWGMFYNCPVDVERLPWYTREMMRI